MRRVLAVSALVLALAGCSPAEDNGAAPETPASATSAPPETLTADLVFPEKVTLAGGLELTRTGKWDYDACPEADAALDALYEDCLYRIEASYASADKKIVVAFQILAFTPNTGDHNDDIVAAKTSGAFNDFPPPKGIETRYTFNAKALARYIAAVAVAGGNGGSHTEAEKWATPGLDWVYGRTGEFV